MQLTTPLLLKMSPVHHGGTHSVGKLQLVKKYIQFFFIIYGNQEVMWLIICGGKMIESPAPVVVIEL